MSHTRNIAYYTYNSLMTPGHADIELILNVLCTIITDTDRIRVHAQTVNVLNVTSKEEVLIEITDMPVTEHANVLRTYCS